MKQSYRKGEVLVATVILALLISITAEVFYGEPMQEDNNTTKVIK